MRFLLSWVLSSVALAITAQLLGNHMNIGQAGQTLQQKLIPLAVVGLVFSIVNAFVAPIVKLLSLPVVVLSLGLFLLVINAWLLLLTEWVGSKFPVNGSIPFQVDGFWWALLGAVVVSVTNTVIGSIARKA